MNSSFYIRDICVKKEVNSIIKDNNEIPLEPKVMHLLCLLASNPKSTFSKEEITNYLWPSTVVGDDTIARCISKLRKALGDDAKSPIYIETISKKGYRLIQSVTKNKRANYEYEFGLNKLIEKKSYIWLVGVGLIFLIINISMFSKRQNSTADKLTLKADILYNNFTQIDNEAALVLYEKAIIYDPNHALAYAGLANCLIQKVIRWSDKSDSNLSAGSGLTYALENNITTQKDAVSILNNANYYAEKSFSLSPKDPKVLKSLALSYSVQRKFNPAIELYKKSIQANEYEWRSLLNLAELYQISKQPELAIDYLNKAYIATEIIYQKNPLEVSLWQTRIGYLIGKEYENAGAIEKAKVWYKRVISNSPYDIPSNLSLALILFKTGKNEEAINICNVIQGKVGALSECQNFTTVL